MTLYCLFLKELIFFVLSNAPSNDIWATFFDCLMREINALHGFLFTEINNDVIFAYSRKKNGSITRHF